MEAIWSFIWHEKFWLPGNHTWETFRSGQKDVYYPQLRDLLWFLPFSGVLYLCRYFNERYIFKPIGQHYGLKDVIIKPYVRNQYFEKLYRQERRPDDAKLQQLAIDCNISLKTVQRWFRRRRNYQKSSMLSKFTESGWKFSFYLTSFWLGFFMLFDKFWFKDITHSFRGHPYHSISSGIYIYYVIELSYYWAGLCTIFRDVKRKDFWEMFLHHVATILLMFFSWVTNFVRIGSLIMCLHDAVDYWMEAAKMAQYVKKEKTCGFLFGIFTILWIITRLIIFPSWILYATIKIAANEMEPFPAYYFFNALLLLLQCLHIFWFVLLCRFLKNVFASRELQNDNRSESEMSEESDSDRKSK